MAAASTGGGGLPPMQRGGLVYSFINPQPITKNSIIRFNPRVVDPYRGKKDADPTFVVFEAMRGGTSIGSIYAKESKDPTKPRKRYLGKVGIGRGVFVNDPNTYRTMTKKEMNFEAMLEKLAYDLYQELGRGIFEVPKSYLSRQRIIDQFTRTHRLALYLAGTVDDVVGQGLPANEATVVQEVVSNESLRVMSRFVEGYQDFEYGQTKDPSGARLSFVDYLNTYHCPPEQLLTPEGNLVPIKGLMGLLAVARVVADTDAIGGGGGNAGFVWVKEGDRIIAAQAVKIDPGMAFQFEGIANWANSTYRRMAGKILEDVRDLQIAQNNDRVIVRWTSLTPLQKTEFLQVLFNSSRYLNSPDILDYLFYRDGRFSRSATEQNPREIANQFKEQMERWLNIQLRIYEVELMEFREKYQTQIVCTQHIDQWGEFLLEQQKEQVDLAVTALTLRLEETNRELALSRLAQDAIRQDLEQACQENRELRDTFQATQLRLDQTQLGLEETQLGLEETQLGLEETQLGLDRTQLRLEETQDEMRLLGLKTERAELRAEIVERTMRDQGKLIRGLMERMVSMEARLVASPSMGVQAAPISPQRGGVGVSRGTSVSSSSSSSSNSSSSAPISLSPLW